MNTKTQKTLRLLRELKASSLTLQVASISTNHPAVRMHLSGKLNGFDPSSPTPVDDQVDALVKDEAPPPATQPAKTELDIITQVAGETIGLSVVTHPDNEMAIVCRISVDLTAIEDYEQGVDWQYISDLSITEWWNSPLFTSDAVSVNDGYDDPDGEDSEYSSLIKFPVETTCMEYGVIEVRVSRYASNEGAMFISARDVYSTVRRLVRLAKDMNPLISCDILISTVSDGLVGFIVDNNEVSEADTSGIDWDDLPSDYSRYDVTSDTTNHETNVDGTTVTNIATRILKAMGEIE